MLTRLGTGATVGALPAAAAITGAASGWNYWIVALFVVLTVAVIALAVAAYLPVMHRIPGFGAAMVSAEWELDGRHDLRVGIRRGPGYPAGMPLPPGDTRNREDIVAAIEPRRGHLAVSVENPQREDMPNVTVFVVAPETCFLTEVDESGVATEAGNRILGVWEWTGLLLGRRKRRFFFNLTFANPGDYPICVKVVAAGLYGTFEDRATVRVGEVNRDNQPDVDLLAYVIAGGEDLLAKLNDERIQFGNPSTEVGTLQLALFNAVRHRDDLVALLNESERRYRGAKVGRSYLASLTEDYLRAGYEMRRRLARSAR
jgi:hypothetical protein